MGIIRHTQIYHMKILIIEDEKIAAEYLEKMITDNLVDCQVVGIAASVKEASKLFYRFKPDLLIMDISLGDHLGFEFFEYVDASQLNVIFVTGYQEYALKAIKANAIDYLVKPINIADMVSAVSKAQERFRVRDMYIQESFLNKDEEIQGMMMIWENDKLMPLRISDIIKIKADGSYSKIYIINNKRIQTSKNLGIYESILQKRGFIRIHHQCLINPRHLTSYRPGIRAYVTLSDNVNEFVSKSKKKDLMRILNMS
jgi:two-component system LytT family response regulator